MRKWLSTHGGTRRPGHFRTRPAPRSARLRIEALEVRRMLAAVPELLGELNPGGPSDPDEFVNSGGTVFFRGDNGTNGPELWTTDGTTSGTVMVKDIAPSAAGSAPAEMTDVGGTLFFAADDGTNGVELWKSDGTAAGTTLVKNINPGGGSFPAELTNVSGTLFFAADDGVNGIELWKSDGTEAGTVMVLDIHSSGSGNPRYLTAHDGKLFFSANDGSNGSELWMSDPGTSTTTIVKDINPGSYGSYPGYFSSLTNVGGILFFSAFDAANGFELWKSDGTAPGTTLVKDVRSGADSSFPFVMTNVAGTLFFTADDGPTGFELWKSDGTGGGTVQVKDINPAGDSAPDELTNVGGTLFFRASDGINGSELWKSDGTGVGTQMVLDINAAGSSLPQYLTDVNGTLYFRADEGTTGGLTGTELWSSDGTPGGTALVADIAPDEASADPRALTNVAGTLLFSAESTANDQEPWIARAPAASVVAEHLFYNESAFDGNDPAANPDDDTAIATDKAAYLPGSGLATFANVSSYVHGINGVMFDLAGTHGTFSAADFTLQVGQSNTPATWPLAPDPVSVSVRSGAGAGGSDRVELIWANGAIANTWLRVVVNDNWNTNLQAPHAFLFGNRIGDSGTGNSTYWAITSAADELFARISAGVGYPVTFPGDYNRDSVVDPTDEAIANDNSGGLPYLNVVASVVGRHLFYNDSKFDGDDAAINAADDGAIAIDKVAYLPGSGTIGPASVTSYTRGVNGVMIDLADASGAVTLDDLTFRMSGAGTDANNAPSTWVAAPAPAAFWVRADAGVGGSDRVEIVWADGAIVNRYLQVIVEGNDAIGGFNTNTGLPASDVFFFGNIVGDTFENTPALVFFVGSSDEISIRANPGPATITNIWDIDRNGVAGLGSDQIAARGNSPFFLARINIANPPAAPGAQGPSGEGEAAIGSMVADAVVSSFVLRADHRWAALNAADRREVVPSRWTRESFSVVNASLLWTMSAPMVDHATQEAIGEIGDLLLWDDDLLDDLATKPLRVSPA